jgi:hypothetical protein
LDSKLTKYIELEWMIGNQKINNKRLIKLQKNMDI